MALIVEEEEADRASHGLETLETIRMMTMLVESVGGERFPLASSSVSCGRRLELEP